MTFKKYYVKFNSLIQYYQHHLLGRLLFRSIIANTNRNRFSRIHLKYPNESALLLYSDNCLIIYSYIPHLIICIHFSIPASNLSTNCLQTLDRVGNALLQRSELDTEHVNRALVVELVHTICRVIAARRARRRQDILVLRVLLLDGLGDLPIGKVASGDEEALVGSPLLLNSRHMALGEVAHVDPDENSRLGDLVLGLALDQIAHTLVGGVESVQAVEVVHDGAQDERWAHGGDAEVGLLLLDEVPGGALGECLAGAVAIGRVLDCLLRCDGVPVFLAVHVAGPGALEGVED